MGRPVIFLVRSRAVAATDTHIYVIEQGQMKQSEVKEVRERPFSPRGPNGLIALSRLRFVRERV